MSVLLRLALYLARVANGDYLSAIIVKIKSLSQ